MWAVKLCLQSSPGNAAAFLKSLLCLGGADQVTGWAAHADAHEESHEAWPCLSCPWCWSCSAGLREAEGRLLPLSQFCHDHPALLPAPGKWRRQGERPQRLGQTSHSVPVTADLAAITAAFKLSPSFGFGWQALSCSSHLLLSLALPGCLQLFQFAAAAWVMPHEWKAAKALSSRSSSWLSYWFSSQGSHLWPAGCPCQA